MLSESKTRAVILAMVAQVEKVVLGEVVAEAVMGRPVTVLTTVILVPRVNADEEVRKGCEMAVTESFVSMSSQKTPGKT
jgi:hypothetical protein